MDRACSPSERLQPGQEVDIIRIGNEMGLITWHRGIKKAITKLVRVTYPVGDQGTWRTHDHLLSRIWLMTGASGTLAAISWLIYKIRNYCCLPFTWALFFPHLACIKVKKNNPQPWSQGKIVTMNSAVNSVGTSLMGQIVDERNDDPSFGFLSFGWSSRYLHGSRFSSIYILFFRGTACQSFWTFCIFDNSRKQTFYFPCMNQLYANLMMCKQESPPMTLFLDIFMILLVITCNFAWTTLRGVLPLVIRFLI